MSKFLTNRQISLMIYCITVGYGVIDLPSEAAQNAGAGSWFSLLILTIIIMVITYMITYLQYTFEGKTLYEYGQQLVGKTITYIFLIVYIIYFFLNFTMITRIYAETLKMIILNKTPIIAICALFYIVVFYALAKGINVIARVCELYGILNIIGFMFINTLLLTKGRFVHIRPLFVVQDLGIYFSAIFKIVIAFLGAEILFVLPLSRQHNKKALKYTTFIVGFIGIIYIYIVESVISVVGVEAVVHYQVSLLDVIRGTDIYYLEFFRRLDGIYMVYWSMNIICAICLWGYGVITFANKITRNIKYKYIVAGVTIIGFIAAQIPKTKDQIESIIKYNSYFAAIATIVILIILLTIIKVKKYDKKI